MSKTLSQDPYRNTVYSSILEAAQQSNIQVEKLANIGYNLMRKAKLHHHFFADFSLLTTAKYLIFFYLKLPYEYNNKKYLQRKISAEEALGIIDLFEKRIVERLPVEYITQEAWYLGHKFYVNEHVLVPRSSMNTRFTDFLNKVHWQNFSVLDLCAGSGCIGISLALINPNISVDLLDISDQALEVASINIKKYNLNDRLKCIQSNLFENVQKKYDLIISNPPYVSSSEYQSATREFKNEPKIALEAGVDGLVIIEKILSQAKNFLNEKGLLIAEVGTSAAKLIKSRYSNIPFKWFKYRKPVETSSLFDRWVLKIFGSECIFLCEAKDLPNIKNSR